MTGKAYFYISFFVLLLCFGISCNKTETRTLSDDFSYYPLTPGHFVSYSVDSFYYSASNYPQIIIDTIHYEIKEKIDTAFVDNEGRTAYRIERYRRPDEASDWSIDRIWSATNNNLIIDKNEDDLHFIKLVFPVAEAKVWKGNAMIVATDENEYLKDWEYKYSDVNLPYTVGTTSFDSTLLVTQVNEENLIEKKYAYERYAKGVGMIYKEIKFLGKQRDLTNGWDFPETGVWVRYVYTGSGEE